MVVDDSAVIRGILSRLLDADPNVKVVSSASDGEMAVNALDRYYIEVVVLDIEMPRMDGLTALPKLIAKDPHIKVIMASTLTRKNAEISLKALAAGAADYIPKPSSSTEMRMGEGFTREFVEKVKALGQARRSKRSTRPVARPGQPPRPLAQPPQPAIRSLYSQPIKLRPQRAPFRPKVLAIGSSTGGPQALLQVFQPLAGQIEWPVLITQHMPATFTTILAEHIGRASGVKTAEAVDGEPIIAGRIYVAPGDFHMVVDQVRGGMVLRLERTPPENFCRPAVDPLMRSVARHYGAHALAIILTGMGQDGLKGCTGVVAAGGTVIAQDEQSSVVWGMPGAVATAGLCTAVLPLFKIAPHLRNLAKRSAA
jgi:two-component system chemotaxis response regulator CheB